MLTVSTVVERATDLRRMVKDMRRIVPVAHQLQVALIEED